jgi:hypothetical protein
MNKQLIHRYSALELNTIYQLRSEGYTFKEITLKINKQFNTNRTEHKIECKLSHSTKKARTVKKKKLTIEDKTIINNIKKYPTNIKYALTLSAEELRTTFEKLNNRYYKHLKYSHTILTVGTEIGFSNNVKNTLRDIDGNLKLPDMNDVQWLMKQILNLSEQERNTIKLLLT